MEVIKNHPDTQNSVNGINTTSGENSLSKFVDILLSAYTIEALYKAEPKSLSTYFYQWLKSLEKRTVEETKEIIIELAVSGSLIEYWTYDH